MREALERWTRRVVDVRLAFLSAAERSDGQLLQRAWTVWTAALARQGDLEKLGLSFIDVKREGKPQMAVPACARLTRRGRQHAAHLQPLARRHAHVSHAARERSGVHRAEAAAHARAGLDGLVGSPRRGVSSPAGASSRWCSLGRSTDAVAHRSIA
jgi:hypothetical protein